jgi:hypothetical protein
MLIVAPNGIENEDTSSETPSCDNVSNVNGIVALDDVEENANIKTDENFFMKFIGLNLVNNSNSNGYIITDCMIIAKITHAMNLNNGINASNPKVANVDAIRQNIPIGANFITQMVIFIIILLNCVKKSLTRRVSSFSTDNIPPIIRANMIVGIISPLANEPIGFDGIMFRRLSVNVTLLVTFDV